MNYLALGDSYTIGEALPEKESFPFLLRDELLKQYQAVKLTVIAQTGWTAQELQQAIPLDYLKQTSFDVITLLIGVNNQYRGQGLEQFQVEFEDLVNNIKSLIQAHTKVVVLSIPNYAKTPFVKFNHEQITVQIEVYNTFLKQQALQKQWLFVDNTAFDKEVEFNQALLASDQLHYSTQFYKMWTQNVINTLSTH
jgi:lysophospholipase L1-like esterase